MNAHEYIQKVRDAGFSVALDGDRLMVSPIENLTPDQRQSLSDHKQEIIAALRSSETLIDAEGGHDLEPGNDADVLPSRLVEAASRVCRDHGDDDDQVQVMLDDLRDQPDDWDALEEHFEAQLPAPPEPGMERVRTQAAGYEFDVDVPAEHAPGIRKSVRFMLRDGQGGGSVLGKPGQSEAELREILQQKYADRLASINEQPSPVTCRGCRHAEIGLRPPVVSCGLGLQATNPAGRLADEPHLCGGFEP